MSNYTIIELEERTLKDFISIEHGSDKISMTIFQGKFDRTTEVILKPIQAEVLADQLRSRAGLIRGNTI